jgi:hypothetical protein
MTSPQVLTVKAIATPIEASDQDDPKGWEQVIRMIKGPLEAASEKKL